MLLVYLLAFRPTTRLSSRLAKSKLSDSAKVTDIESDSNGGNDESDYNDEDVEEDNDNDDEDVANDEDYNDDDGNRNNEDNDSDVQSVEIIDKDVFIECVKNISHNTLD